MTHLCVHEWGQVPVGSCGFTRAQVNALIAAARAHPLGGDEGLGILSDHHTHLRAKQMVGVIAAGGCSLEILPKVDPDAPDEATGTVRARLVHMLDVALGLELGDGAAAAMARQPHSLLDILIRLFADRLLAETRRGLPRAYVRHEENLPALRGRLDCVAQFTRNAVRPDRLACRYDALSSDIALLQVMKTAVVSLAKHARAPETRRRLDELRFVLADISDVAPNALPWTQVRIDRTNRRWTVLLTLTKLFLKREWQATHRDAKQDGGITLLFAMNDLFEAYVAALLRRALAGSGIDVVAQGGLRHCLGDWRDDAPVRADRFQTKPDILLRRDGHHLAVIDTKWKRLASDPFDRKRGVSQADIYQMMAYARLYDCPRLMLLYPSVPGFSSASPRRFGISGGGEMLALGRIDVTGTRDAVTGALGVLARDLLQSEHWPATHRTGVGGRGVDAKE